MGSEEEMALYNSVKERLESIEAELALLDESSQSVLLCSDLRDEQAEMKAMLEEFHDAEYEINAPSETGYSTPITINTDSPRSDDEKKSIPMLDKSRKSICLLCTMMLSLNKILYSCRK